MKKLRRSLALLLIAAILVNSTDFSLLTVNAEEQTATEGKAPSGNNESSEEQDAEAQSSETENTDAEGEEAAPPEDGSGDAAGPAEGQDGSDGTVSQPGTGKTVDPAGHPGDGETNGSDGQPADDGAEGIENSGSDGAENPPVSDEDQGTNGEPGSGENPGTPSDDGESEDAQDGTPDADTPSGEEQVPAVPGAEQPADPDQVLPPANLAPSLPGETDEETVPTIIGVDFTDEDKAAYVQNQTVPIGAALDAVRLPGTVIGIVDAADGADGEEAADETVELTVSEWVITGPEGVTECDTYASEEDENMPKQGFYEFAPVLADLPEGYEWSETVPEGYDTWEEYLENWMKISVTVGAENENAKIDEPVEGGEYIISLYSLTDGEFYYDDEYAVRFGVENIQQDPNYGKIYAVLESGILTLTAKGDSKYTFIGEQGNNQGNLGIRFAQESGMQSVDLEFDGVSINAPSDETLISLENVESVNITVIADTALNGQGGSVFSIPAGKEVTTSGNGSLTFGGYTDSSVIINAGELSLGGTVIIDGPEYEEYVIDNRGGILTTVGNISITSANDAVYGGTFNVGGTFLATSSRNNRDLVKVETLQGMPLLSGKFDGIAGADVTIFNSKGDAVATLPTEGMGNFVRNLPTDNYTITSLDSNGREMKYVGTPSTGGDETSDFTVSTTGISEYTNIHTIYLPVFWQAHGENITFNSADLVGEVDTNHGLYQGNQVLLNWGFELIEIQDPSGQTVEVGNWASAFDGTEIPDDHIFVVENSGLASIPGTDPLGKTYRYSINGLRENYTYIFKPCVETKFGWESPLEVLQAVDKIKGSADSTIVIKPLYLNLPDKITYTYGELLDGINDANSMQSKHPSLSMSKTDGTVVNSGEFIPEGQKDQAGNVVAGDFYIYKGAEAITDREQVSTISGQMNTVWDAGTYGADTWITFVPANESIGLVSQEVNITVNRRPLAVTSVQNTTKEYDGTKVIDVQAVSGFEPRPYRDENIDSCTSVQNTLQADGVSVIQTGTEGMSLRGTLESKNVGEGYDLTLTGLSVSSTQGKADNYLLEQDVTLADVGSITAKNVTLDIVSREIRTGETIPDTFELALAAGETLGEGDELADVAGAPVFVIADIPKSFDEDTDYTGQNLVYSVTTGQPEGASANYTFSYNPGTLTVHYETAEDKFVSNAGANTEGWYNDPSLVLSPKEDSGYNQIRVGVKQTNGSIVWEDEWKSEWTFTGSAVHDDLVIQLKDNETGAFTAWTAPEDYRIDSEAPEIIDIKYRDKTSGDGGFISDMINFLTFGNYYKDTVVVEVYVSDNLSGVKEVQYTIDDASQAAEFDEGNKVAIFEISKAGTQEVTINVSDYAGNATGATVLRDENGNNADATWVIDRTAPQITVTPDKTAVIGNDGKQWYQVESVTLTISVKDTDGLDKIYRKVGDGEYEVLEDILYKDATKETDTYSYKDVIAGTTEGIDTSEGITYQYKVVDLAGNETESSKYTLRIDSKPPVVTSPAVQPDTFINAETGKTATITFKASDAESGIYAGSVKIQRIEGADGSAVTDEAKTVSVENGVYTYTEIFAAGKYRVTVQDVSGRESSQDVTVNKYDDQIPSITNVTALGNTGNGNWNNTGVTVTVTANDASVTADSVKSGLAKLQYAYNSRDDWKDVEWDTVSGALTVTIDQDGKNTVYLRVVDKAGNISEVKGIVVWIDEDIPELKVEATSDGSTYIEDTYATKPVEFKLSVTNQDELESDVHYEIQLDDGTWTDIENYFVGKEGYYWDAQTNTLTVGYNVSDNFAVDSDFHFRAVTGSGQTKEVDFGQVKVSIINVAEPEITVAPAAAEWYNINSGNPTVTVTAAEQSTVPDAAEVTTTYRWREQGTEDWTEGTVDKDTGTAVILLTESGIYEFEASAEDAAGNQSETVSKRVKLDNQAPGIRESGITYKKTNNSEVANLLNKLSFGIFFKESIQVTVAAQDDESGVDKLTYQIGDAGDLKSAGKSNDIFTFELPVNETTSYVLLKLTDNAGNEYEFNLGTDLVNTEEPVWILENVPPVISDVKVNEDVLSTDKNSAEWYNSEVTVSATVTDEKSGIDSVAYNFGEEQTISGISDQYEDYASLPGTYAFSQTASSEGVTEITIQATDLAMNKSDITKGYVKIDTGEPVITGVTPGVPEGTWSNEAYTVTFEVSDPPKDGANESSGIDPASVKVTRIKTGLGSEFKSEMDVKADNGRYSFEVSANGVYQIYVEDFAGNSITYDVNIDNIDKLAPVKNTDTGLTIDPDTEKDGDIYTEDVVITVEADDAPATEDDGESGIYSFVWSYATEDGKIGDSGTTLWKDSHTFTLNKTGEFDVSVSIRDHAGNVLEKLTLNNIRINNGKPTMTVNAVTAEQETYSGEWTNSRSVIWHLELDNPEVTGDNYALWAKADGSGEYLNINQYANQVNGTWNSEEKTLTISEEGVYNTTFRITNADGNNETLYPDKYTRIDRQNPENITASPDGIKENDSNEWYIGGPDGAARPHINLTQLPVQTDTEAPVYTEYKLWQGDTEPSTWTEYDGNKNGGSALTEIDSDGIWYFTYRVTDEAGNSPTEGETLTIKVDTAAQSPNMITVSPADGILSNIFGNFFNKDIEITVTADEGVSGLREMKYQIRETDGTLREGTANFANGIASFEVSPETAEGIYDGTISISLVDNAGNATGFETIEQSGYTGDWTVESMAPTTELTAQGEGGTEANDYWYTSPVTFTMTAKDKGGVSNLTVSSTGDSIDAAWYIWNYIDTQTGADIQEDSTDKKPIKVEAQKTTGEAEQGTITYTLQAQDMAGNSSTPQENVNQLTVKIDTVAPEIGDITFTGEEPASGWTNESRTYQFTLTDATSGIDENTIVITGPDILPEGQTSAQNTLKEISEGVWQFEAPVNGTYTVDVKDMAGNAAESKTIGVTNIDKVNPDNATVTLNPPNPNGNEGWYKGEGSWGQALIIPAAPDDGSPITTYYDLLDLTDENAQPVQHTVTGDSEYVNFESGQWRLTVYTIDAAENRCEEEYIRDIKIDTVAPTISTGEMKFTDGSGNLLESLINWLSFGNFYNEAVTVTIPISDEHSGVDTFYYQIPGEEVKQQAVREKDSAVVRLPLGTDAANQNIEIWLGDVAGNETSPMDLKKDSDTGHWVIEGEVPVLPEVTVKDDVKPSETGWYLQDITLQGTAQDTKSGLNLMRWMGTEQDTDEEEPTERDPVIVFENPTGIDTSERSGELSLTEDGVYNIYLYAMDNSKNGAQTETVTYKIDATKPTLTVTNHETGGDPIETPVNEPQVIDIQVNDATSGIKEGSLKVYYMDDENNRHDLPRDSEDGYIISEELERAYFTACAKGTYYIEISDVAGNVQTYSFENNLVDVIQGDEYVTVNQIKAVSTRVESPWYNAVPQVEITTPHNDVADVKTFYYVANPTEGELLRISDTDEGNLIVATEGLNPTFNSEIKDTSRIQSFTALAENDTTIERVSKELFTLNGADRDGTYIIYIQSVDEAGGIGQLSKYYVRIDRGDPVINQVEVADPDKWTRSKNVTFYAGDKPANDAGERDVSGIRGNNYTVFITTPSRPEKPYNVQGNDFTYTATENGTYTITVSDNINAMKEDGKTPQERHTVTDTFTITNIDTTVPENAAISLEGETEGNIVEGNRWYKETDPTIVITPPDQPMETEGDASPIITHYTITCNGTVMASGEISPDQQEAYKYKVDGNGVWKITTWTVDEAGNVSSPKEQEVTYHIDTAEPTVNVEDISIKSVENNNIEDIIHTLTFGVFFKEGIRITVPVNEATEYESGVKTLWYKLNGGIEQEANSNGDGTFSFIINEQFSGTIDLITEDNAGNKGSGVRMYNNIVDGGNKSGDTWVVDLEKPVISVTSDAEKSDYGWYKADVELTVTVGGGTGENVSGVNNITWTLQKEGDEAKNQADLYSNPTRIEKSVTEKTMLDKNLNGKYTAVFYAEDNAKNAADPVTQQYWIDSEMPEISGIQNPTDWAQEKTIEFTLSDGVSGIWEDSIEVVLVNNDGTKTEQTVTKTADDVRVPEDTDAGLGAVAGSYTCSFTVQTNGTYKVTFRDAADNEVTEEIAVSKIDRTVPENPTIHVNNSPDIAGWYNGNSYPEVSGVKNAQGDENANIAPVRTMYQMWNTETDSAPVASELIGEENDQTAAEGPKLTKDGMWKVVMWNVDAAGNVSEKVDATFGVDTVIPVITDQTVEPSAFVQHMDAEFTLEDPKKEGDGHGDPSGIDVSSLTVIFDPEGNGEAYEVDAADIRYEEGVYRIDTTVNGTYTINVKDTAGNPAQEVSIILNKISSVRPSNVNLEIQGTKGMREDTETGWYLYDIEKGGVNLHFTTLTPPGEGVRVDVKYLLWKDGEEKPSDESAVVTQTQGEGVTIDRLIDEGGIWNLEYWTVSESGLESESRGTAAIKYDPEDSRILTSEIEYTDVNDNPIAHLINWLTFGTFFNEAVRVEIPVEDNFSGAVQLRYQIGGGAEQTEVITEGRTSFEIPLGTKGQIILNVADAAGNVSDNYIMRNLKGEETAWVLENNLPTAQSRKPSLNATGVAVMGEDALTEIELFFSERVVWKEGGQLTISTGEKTYTATMHEDEIPLIPDEGAACTTSVPIERFVDENGEPLKLELNEIYTLVVKAGAFMDYATNENEEALLSAFQTGQELDPGEETPLSNLGLELSEGVTMFPAFDPETTGYTLIVGEEAMDGNHLAQDMVFSPILKGDANIEEAVLTDMMGRELASYEIGADGSFTVPKEAIEEHKNYFIRMTASRYGIETVYNFLVSTSAYNEVITLATSDMSAIEVDGLRNTVDVAEETVEGNKVVVQFVASIPREETTAQQLDPIRAVAGDEKGYYSLDLAINKFRSDGVSEELHELDMPVRITVELPDELLGKDTYEVYRNHEGAVDRLDCTLSADGKRLSFESDRFSFYTIAYTPYTPESTGDNGGSGGGTTTETVYVQVPGGTVTETVYITSGGGRPGSGTVTTVPVTDGSADTEEIPASSPRTDEEPDQTAETEEEETKVTSQEDVLAGIPQGLALADLACMVASMMLAEYSYCKQKKLRKILGTIFAAALIILFFLTQPLEGLIAWTDRWTIFFVITAAVHANVTVIPQRKDKDGDGEDGQDGAKPAEG